MPASRAAVLGSPIGHSLSPVLHRAAYRALGLDWGYDLVECDEAALPATLQRLAASHAGLSLTMPLKAAVIPLLDEVDPPALAIGAVNTVVFADRGRRRGFNTDVAGVTATLTELDLSLAGARVALLGAGGAARAVLAALATVGIGEVRIVAREPSRAVALRELAERLALPAAVAPWGSEALAGATLVISAVPPLPALASLAAGGWPGGAALFDLGYAPWPTPLASVAMAAGAPVISGLPMLIAQAAEQVTLMTGRPAPLAEMRAAGAAALAART